MPAKLTRYEQETIINFNEGEETMSVYTHNRALRRKLEQLAQDRPEECRLYRVTHWNEAVEYYVPKSWVHIYPPRQISEEQRAAMAARLKKANLRRDTPTAQGVEEGPDAETGKDTSQATDSEKEE